MINSQQHMKQYEKEMQCLRNHVEVYRRHMEQAQKDLEDARCQLNDSCRDQEELRRTLTQKEESVSCLESTLCKFKNEQKENEKVFVRKYDTLKDKLYCLCEQVKQKDSALCLCQKEVKAHLTKMEELKSNFCFDLQQKETLLCQMRDNLRRVYDELKCKTEENSKLSRNVLELEDQLGQAESHCGEAATKVAFLQDKIPLLECQFSKEKKQAVSEMEDFEKKLNQTLNELSYAANECRKMKRLIKEKEDEVETLCSEKAELCNELDCEREQIKTLRNRMECLENDNKDICRLLQLKMKTLKEIEQTLCIRDQELHCCRCKVEELEDKIRKLGTGGDSDGTDVEAQLARCLSALTKCEGERKELEKKLQYAIREMEKLAKEVKRLQCDLDEAKQEICDKTALVCDLETALSQAEQDTETRMCRVDQQLEKYEKEIQDKTRMILETEEKCCRLNSNLNDKNLEVEQLEQRLSRCYCDLETLRCQHQELAEAKQCLQTSYNEIKLKHAELCQESHLCREQLQMACKEINSLKKDLCNCQREVESHAKESSDMRSILQEKEYQIQQLLDDKGCLSSKLASTQCRLEGEVNELGQKLAETKNRLECETEDLKRRLCESEDTNASLGQKLCNKERQLCQVEKNLCQKVEALTRENDLLQNKVNDKDYQIQASKDCITLKESEIMRLQLRLCSYDRCNERCNDHCNDRCNNNKICERCPDPNFCRCKPRQPSISPTPLSRRRAKSCDSRQPWY